MLEENKENTTDARRAERQRLLTIALTVLACAALIASSLSLTFAWDVRSADKPINVMVVDHASLLLEHPELKLAEDIEPIAQKIDVAVEMLVQGGVTVVRPEAVVAAPDTAMLSWGQVEALNELAAQ